MTTRKRLSERATLAVAINQGAVIPCYRCRVAFDSETIKTAEREHIHEIALGGEDVVENMAYSHRACHAKVTNGEGATTAGSSKGRIAKANRIAKGGKKRNGPAIQSRGFSKPPEGYSAWKKRIKEIDNG